jgi:hypothetical protein
MRLSSRLPRGLAMRRVIVNPGGRLANGPAVVGGCGIVIVPCDAQISPRAVD